MMDNPDAAYAKLREMGKGMFGPDGAGLGNMLSNLGGNFGLGGTAAPGGGNATGATSPQMQLPGPTTMPGGQLGEAIGNLIQQGLSNGPLTNGAGTGTGRSRGLPGTSTTPAPQASPAPPTQAPSSQDAPLAQQDSQPMNDVMRQLFNR